MACFLPSLGGWFLLLLTCMCCDQLLGQTKWFDSVLLNLWLFRTRSSAIAERPTRLVIMLLKCCPTVVRVMQTDRILAWGDLCHVLFCSSGIVLYTHLSTIAQWACDVTGVIVIFVFIYQNLQSRFGIERYSYTETNSVCMYVCVKTRPKPLNRFA